MGIWKWIKEGARVAAAIGTGGLSEVALAGLDAAGVDVGAGPTGYDVLTGGYNEVKNAFKGPGAGGYKWAGREQQSLAELLKQRALGAGGPSQAATLGTAMARGVRGNPYLALRQGIAGAEQADVLERMGAEQQLGNVLAQARGAAVQQQGQQLNVIGSGLQAAGSGIASAVASDRAVKKDIEPGDGSARRFLDSLNAYRFRYANESEAAPERLGVMAQDVEHGGPAGRAIVKDTAGGKVLDVGAGFGAALAALADLHQRVAKLEGGRRPRARAG